MSNIKLRFVTCRDPISQGIRLRENFWASHVEAMTPQGKYLGAHCDGGVQARDVGYDAQVLQQELFVELPETAPGQADEFYAFLDRHIGEPYDFESILGFLVPNIATHQPQHIICSALQALALGNANGSPCRWSSRRTRSRRAISC
jgi:hypothetical protein